MEPGVLFFMECMGGGGGGGVEESSPVVILWLFRSPRRGPGAVVCGGGSGRTDGGNR